MGFLFGLCADRPFSEGGVIAFGVLYLSNYRALSQIFGDGFSQVEGSSNKRLSLDLLAVLELNGELVTVTVISGFSTASSCF